MKRVISILMVAAMLLSFVTVVTAAPVENLSGYKSVVVKGDTAYDSGTIVSVIAEDKDKTMVHAGMTECKIGGSFFYKFTCDNPRDLSVRVKKGDTPVEDYSVTVLSDQVPCDVSLSLLNAAGKRAHVPYEKGPFTIKAEVFNIYADEDAYQLILAAYAEDGRLLQASPVDKTLEYDKNGDKFIQESETALTEEASNDVYEVKAFAWTKDTLMPLASSICSGTKNSSGLANLNDAPGELKVAFLGGSITEGAGASDKSKRYSSLLIENYFKTKYPNKTVTEINAGIGGTGSDQGIIRLQKDIISQEPDVVFLEYAVNDQCAASETALREERLSYYEDLITGLANAPKQPVIIMLYSGSYRNGYPYGAYNGVGGDKPLDCDNAGKYQQALADHYGIGSVDFDGYLKGLFDGGNLESWYQYYVADAVHPNDDGHAAYANYIKTCFDTDYDKYFKYVDTNKARIRESLMGTPELISHDNPRIVYSGEWENTRHPSISGNFPYYTNQYHQSPVGVKSSFTFEFTGKVFGIYGVRDSLGMASFDYDIDNGLRTGTVQVKQGGAWYNLLYLLCIKDLPEGKHTVTVTVNGDEVSGTDSSGNPKYKTPLKFGWLIVDERAE